MLFIILKNIEWVVFGLPVNNLGTFEYVPVQLSDTVNQLVPLSI